MTRDRAGPHDGRDWRGVAAEDADELSAGAGILLRARSRRLLGELLRPHRRALWALLVVVTVQNVAWLAGPVPGRRRHRRRASRRWSTATPGR